MILVTGGTGFVGKEIVRQLAQAGHRVRVLARHPERVEKGAITLDLPPNVEFVRGDVLNPASLEAAMTGVTAVIHLVGILFETPWISYEQAHIDSTVNVLNAARAAAVKRYLHMSALGTRSSAIARYHRTKWEAEERVRQSGLDWTILRPSLIYGPGDKSFNLLSSFLRWPFDFMNFYSFPNLGGGKARVQPIAVGDVAKSFVNALSNSATVGKTYDLCGPKDLSWTEILLRLAKKERLDVVLDTHATLFALRSILWAFLLAVPVVALLGVLFHLLHERGLILLAAVEAGLFLGARYWTQFLFYPVPWVFVNIPARLFEYLPWTWLHFGELLKLMQEDNVGDPIPAQNDLHLKFQPYLD